MACFPVFVLCASCATFRVVEAPLVGVFCGKEGDDWHLEPFFEVIRLGSSSCCVCSGGGCFIWRVGLWGFVVSGVCRVVPSCRIRAGGGGGRCPYAPEVTCCYRGETRWTGCGGARRGDGVGG